MKQSLVGYVYNVSIMLAVMLLWRVTLFCGLPGGVPVRKKKPSKPAALCGYPTHQLALLTPQTLTHHTFPLAYPWTLAFRKSLQLTGVWPEWRPKAADWTLVDDV